MRAHREDSGQALVLLVGALLAICAGAAALGWLAAGLAAAGDRQRVADLAALAGARALLDAQPRTLARGAGQGPGLTPAAYRALARRTARATARRNGARRVEVRFPSGPMPTRIAVTVSDPIHGPGALIGGSAEAEAEMAAGGAFTGGDGEYAGLLAYRQGKPMRPDVALAFDRLAGAARRAGHRLVITSAYRSAAEQARLFAAHPDPKWVAPAGKSLHRLGTELDVGPRTAYAWLAANSERFGFIRRYPWEAWHFGFGLSPGSASVGFSRQRGGATAGGRYVQNGGDGGAASRSGGSGGTLPAWVPPAYAPLILASAQRWGVGAALLAAQLRQESGFNPRAVSRAGARGLAQFMPATARSYGLRDPFDPAAAIDAQAHHMRDLLRRFGSVPLALAAYNAGPGRVASCWCVPPIAETQDYVRRIVALARGEGLTTAAALVRLVR